LDGILYQGKRETQMQTNELNTLLHEREIITRQLSKRSNELALLYEKIRIQQSLLLKGSNRYRQLLAEIESVELLIKQKANKLTRLSIGNRKLAELRSEYQGTIKQLEEEQAKSLLLSEELSKKINVHAFRRLMEADPEVYEVLQKMQALEKRIIARIDQISGLKKLRDQLLDEIEDTKVKIKRSRDIAELQAECEERKAYVQSRNEQIGSLESEISTLRTEVYDSKLEIAKLADEKIEVMKKFYAGKTKERKLMESIQNETANKSSSVQGKLVYSIPRFTGGGFCLSRPE
jgi:chromosome segregation ATPase